MNDFFLKYKQELIDSINDLSFMDIEQIFQSMLDSYIKNKKIIIIGNGGSAATASHFSCDLGKGTSIEGVRRFKVISLTDNMPLITAISNDISYDEVFKYQLENILEKDDLVIGISASGNSENIVRAFEYAKSKSAKTFGLVGFTGGKIKDLSDGYIHVKSFNYGIVEDIHLIIEHILTQYFKKYMEEMSVNKSNKIIGNEY